jgi:catechol 2,3-dioxygenase-like lactoylglutathione lyase family enzyme
MEVLFVASIALIAENPAVSRRLFVDSLGLPLESTGGDEYFHSERIDGSKHFGVWPLAQAAQACFGSDEWPEAHARPQACVEFEVKDAAAVAAAAAELEAAGYSLLHGARTEPWGQTVARFLSPEGAILGISFAPWLHESAVAPNA